VTPDLRDPETFERIYREHVARVVGAARRVLGDVARAEEAAHDVFLRLWLRPERFDASRGDLGSYLCMMARSRAVDLWRSEQSLGRATDRLTSLSASEPRHEEGPAAATERHASREEVRRALARLPRAQRDTVILAYWGELPPSEIARRSGTPLGTVRSRLRLARERLALDEPGLAEAA
jgi:RNA polymerase sigma-70 factor (ECF subfamily)